MQHYREQKRRRRRRPREFKPITPNTGFSSTVQYGPGLYQGYFAQGLYADAKGTITIKRITGNDVIAIGGGSLVYYLYHLDKKHGFAGYMVQKVWLVTDIEHCVTGVKTQSTVTYYEAWEVEKNHIYEKKLNDVVFVKKGYYTDKTGFPSFANHKGELIKKGLVRFFSAAVTKNIAGFGGAEQVPNSGTLPSTKKEPAWWQKGMVAGEKQAVRTYTRLFNNCKKGAFEREACTVRKAKQLISGKDVDKLKYQ